MGVVKMCTKNKYKGRKSGMQDTTPAHKPTCMKERKIKNNLFTSDIILSSFLLLLCVSHGDERRNKDNR
jgi:hypothetical protein